MDEQERDHGASEGEAGIEETLEDCIQDVFPGARVEISKINGW